MPKVLSLKEDSFDGSDGTRVICWKVELDDKTIPVPCYSAEASKLVVGEPLPAGWEVKVSAKGKDYLAVPKAGKGGFGGQSSWYNSEAGVRFTQERMDRRTALMQAIEGTQAGSPEDWVLGRAERFYDWLRATKSVREEKVVGGAGSGSAYSQDANGDQRSSLTSSTTGAVTAGGSAPEPVVDVVGGGVERAEDEGGSSPPAVPSTSSGGLVEVDGEATSQPSSTTVHVHEWNPAPRDGWVLCADCGKAEKASRVKASA